MKKIFLSLIAILITINFCHAQWMSSGSNIYNTNTGNVGIGTNAPGSLLTVAGEVSAYALRTAGPFGDNINGAPWWGVGVANITLPGSTAPYATQLAGYLGLNLLTGNGQMVMTVNGNVGIGTDNPISSFQVDDGVSKASIGSASGNVTLNYGTSYLGFNASRYSTTGTSYSWSLNTDSYNNGGGVIYGSVLGDMYFAPIPTSGATAQTLTDANIASQVALKISRYGAVYAKQIYVQTGVFPDYVFTPGYHLMPLSAVKSYIAKNHHLPEMPSAAVVEKQGLNVGDNQIKLLQKVEELTLYLLAQQKQIDALKNEIKTLKKKKQKLST